MVVLPWVLESLFLMISLRLGLRWPRRRGQVLSLNQRVLLITSSSLSQSTPWCQRMNFSLKESFCLLRKLIKSRERWEKSFSLKKRKKKKKVLVIPTSSLSSHPFSPLLLPLRGGGRGFWASRGPMLGLRTMKNDLFIWSTRYCLYSGWFFFLSKFRFAIFLRWVYVKIYFFEIFRKQWVEEKGQVAGRWRRVCRAKKYFCFYLGTWLLPDFYNFRFMLILDLKSQLKQKKALLCWWRRWFISLTLFHYSCFIDFWILHIFLRVRIIYVFVFGMEVVFFGCTEELKKNIEWVVKKI